MMQKYTTDKATLILIALLKAHGIKRVIASPGTTNMWFVASIQQDTFFEMYSAPDERSAAYMACGMSASDNKPVIITCTEATASRNYFPALTEAYYRKLPILVITGCHGMDYIGHLYAQTINRTIKPIDTVVESVNIRTCNTPEEEWITNVNINKAILALTHHGGGPSHINIEAGHTLDFSTESLPYVRKISRISYSSKKPSLPIGRKAIFIGSHKMFTEEETLLIEKFCEQNNAVVFCDQTSAYKGKYRIDTSLIAAQKQNVSNIFYLELLIHLGEVSGEQYTQNAIQAKQVWRISIDGEVRDTFHSLSYVFEMSYKDFFLNYNNNNKISNTSFYEDCYSQYKMIKEAIEELPFSNVWIAQQIHNKLPLNSNLHFSIYNSLRSWNFFKLHKSINTYSNVGGFGIVGTLSASIGNALAEPDKICFVIIGDLAFFYDINSIANRHRPTNLRILLINNGKGTEFRNYGHPAYAFGEFADTFIAASNHYGNKSSQLIKHYAEDLGFIYLSASNKKDFEQNIGLFLTSSKEKAIIFEIFTNSEDESDSIRSICNTLKSPPNTKQKLKNFINNIFKKIS